MSKYLIILISFIFVILGAVMFSLNENKNQVCFEENCFNVELADDSVSRTEGLMYRESLGDNEGMLFVFDEPGKYGFWMKNTLIPLDIIWIGSDLNVADIAYGVQPCVEDPCESYVPENEALYVLEVNSGKTEELGIEVGDSVVIN